MQNKTSIDILHIYLIIAIGLIILDGIALLQGQTDGFMLITGGLLGALKVEMPNSAKGGKDDVKQ